MVTRKKKLKLYVWENVLTDYTSGIMFALASSPEEARKKILGGQFSAIMKADLMAEPQVFTKPVGFAVWGGG